MMFVHLTARKEQPEKKQKNSVLVKIGARLLKRSLISLIKFNLSLFLL